MTEPNWIRSYGGPLICMDESLRHSWGGIVRLTSKANNSARNDYERACQCDQLLGSISLSEGDALVLGDHPLRTSFWRAANDGLHIVRVRWAESPIDMNSLLSSADISAFPSVEEDISFTFRGTDIVLFDAVEDGKDDHVSQLHTLSGGNYRISTRIFEPDDHTSFYINQFTPV